MITDEMPLVSVVTTCRNATGTIERTLQSVLGQTYSNIEYWIIDALSQDGTCDVLNRYVPLFGGRMQYVSEPDRGVYDGFNKGVSRCAGQVIGILNADDWYEPDAIANIVAAYRRHPDAAVFYGISRAWDAAGEREMFLHRRHHTTLPMGMTGHPGVFISRAAYQKCGAYLLDYRIAADYELMLRLHQQGGAFMPIDRIVVNTQAGGMSDRQQLTSDLESAAIRRRYGFILRFRYAKLVINAWCNHIRRSVTHWLKAGYGSPSRSMFS